MGTAHRKVSAYTGQYNAEHTETSMLQVGFEPIIRDYARLGQGGHYLLLNNKQLLLPVETSADASSKQNYVCSARVYVTEHTARYVQ
jgi:hypothetical protein